MYWYTIRTNNQRVEEGQMHVFFRKLFLWILRFNQSELMTRVFEPIQFQNLGNMNRLGFSAQDIELYKKYIALFNSIYANAVRYTPAWIGAISQKFMELKVVVKHDVVFLNGVRYAISMLESSEAQTVQAMVTEMRGRNLEQITQWVAYAEEKLTEVRGDLYVQAVDILKINRAVQQELGHCNKILLTLDELRFREFVQLCHTLRYELEMSDLKNMREHEKALVRVLKYIRMILFASRHDNWQEQISYDAWTKKFPTG